MLVGIDAVLAKNAFGFYDISLSDNADLSSTSSFNTAIIMTALCERRASAKEVGNPARRRGWIGNETTPGFEMGSKAWLYEQARLTRSTINGLQTALDNAYQWFVQDNLATKAEVLLAVTQAHYGSIHVTVKLYHSQDQFNSLSFDLWNQTGQG